MQKRERQNERRDRRNKKESEIKKRRNRRAEIKQSVFKGRRDEEDQRE